MRRPKIALLATCAVAVLTTAAFLLWPDDEPRYNGRKLSQWIRGYQQQQRNSAAWTDAQAAIRNIGTNALPHLLKWIQDETPQWRLDLYNTIHRGSRTSWMVETPALKRANCATLAFQALGPAGTNAIPILIRLAQDRTQRNTKARAEVALLLSGSEAALPFIRTNAMGARLPVANACAP